MEQEGSLPHSQEPATCRYSKPDQSSPWTPFNFLKIHLTIVFPSTRWFSKWSLSFKFPHLNPVHTSPPPYVLHALPISFFSILSTEPNWVRGTIVIIIIIIKKQQNSCNTVFPRDIVCLRNISINTLHKGDDDDDDYNNNIFIVVVFVVYCPVLIINLALSMQIGGRC